MNFPQQAGPERDFPLPEQERAEEARKIRRLPLMIRMVLSVIHQDRNLTVEEASELAAGAKRAALAMFPDKELAFDLLYKPRLQRAMRERFHLQETISDVLEIRPVIRQRPNLSGFRFPQR